MTPSINNEIKQLADLYCTWFKQYLSLRSLVAESAVSLYCMKQGTLEPAHHFTACVTCFSCETLILHSSLGLQHRVEAWRLSGACIVLSLVAVEITSAIRWASRCSEHQLTADFSIFWVYLIATSPCHSVCLEINYGPVIWKQPCSKFAQVGLIKVNAPIWTK